MYTDKKQLFLKNDKKGIYSFADTPELCKTLLDSGARLLQFRAKNVDDRTFYKTAKKMLSIIRTYDDAVLIINDRVDIAIALAADGIHIGQKDESCARVIKRVPEDMIVGVSVKTTKDALKAEHAGATYLGAGAVFPTETKPESQVIGIQGLSSIVKAIHIPVVAIGGISLDNVQQVFKAGAHYCAVISQINNSNNIAASLKEFINAVT